MRAGNNIQTEDAPHELRPQVSVAWWPAGEFKTPSLRNLVGRGPFMHQGQFATLTEVIDCYSTLEGAVGRSHYQEWILVPLLLTDGESADLLASLTALAGPLMPQVLLAAPDSPLLPGPGNPDEDGR